MKLLIIGHLGAIGKRFVAVAKHLGLRWAGYDIADPCHDMPVSGITHCLICTPTPSHYHLVNQLSTVTDWQIMCEKPLTMDGAEGYILSLLRGYVVCNWALVHSDIYQPDTCTITYQSHNTGPDGLPWDTCQLLYLSRPDTPLLVKESPVWSATINGQDVAYRQIEESYILMIDMFVHNPAGLWTFDDGYKMTLKCLEVS